MRKNIFITTAAVLFLFVLMTMTSDDRHEKKGDQHHSGFREVVGKDWKAPDTSELGHTHHDDLIRYGRTLIVHTATFFGPQGSIAHISNGMNCGNCHIDAGTRRWGNNFSMVASTYPLFRNRSGKIETVEMRINDCFERSLNGKELADSTKEMKAMIAYIKWVGKDVGRGTKAKGSGIEKLPFLNRAADPARGKIVFLTICQKCHGKNGEGISADNGKEYLYPPLWGKNSYNVGAGIYQVSKFAGYIKNNMPFGTTFTKPQLTVEQAWDVAAFVNSQPRPAKDLSRDWPDISTKPPDYPFGPYSDSFSVQQHKYGPFLPVQQAHEKHVLQSKNSITQTSFLK
ncbi:MAG TPA: c-type cytochrome [Hanamia sp.]|nr:c-type cytochrome [Hanamia sp.]